MMMMMMTMTMTTKYRIKHSVIFLCQSAVVVVVVVLLIIMWWWWDVNDHHHMYRVLWRIYSRSFSYQGRVIAPTLFGIFSSLLLSYSFDSSTDGVYLHTSTEGKLFNLARLCAKTKVKTVFVSEMLFADNAYRGNIAEAHQQIRQRMWKLWPLNQAQENQCECLGCQPSPWNQNRRPHSRGSRQIHLPRFHRLHEHEQNSEISRRATGTMSKLTKRAWGNKYLTERTKMHMYQECVLSKLFHGSVACSKRSDSGERCEVKKAMKSRGGLRSLLRTAPHYLNAWNRLMAVKLGPPTQDRNTAWTLSICDVSGASSASSGKTTSPTVKRCHVLKPQACTPFSASAAWDGSGILIAWVMDASPRKTYTDNWRQESGKSGALFCGSRTRANVTSKHAKFIQTTQKMPRVIVPAGDGQRMK